MYKQIITVIFFLIYSVVNSQEIQKKKPVYSNLKRIGFLYEETKLSQCKECYVIDTIKIFDKFLKIKTEVILLGLNTENGIKKHFSNLYDVKVTNKKKYFTIQFNNTASSSSDEIYVKKVNNNIILYKILKYSASSTNIEIAKNDFEGFPSTFICIQNTNLNMRKGILDFNLLPKPKETIDCFHCPIKYTLDECLKIRESKQKIKWKCLFL